MPLNCAFRDENGRAYDIVADTFFLCAALMCDHAAVDGRVVWTFFDNCFNAKPGAMRANDTNTVPGAAGSDNERGE